MRRVLLIAAVLVVGIAAGVGGALALNRPAKANGACSSTSGQHQSYNVMIMDNKVEPLNTSAKLCDSLTITNMDNLAREIAFGPHEHHVPYDGVAEKVLNVGQSLTITLNQAGSFHFHDHLHDEVQGYFTVKK